MDCSESGTDFLFLNLAQFGSLRRFYFAVMKQTTVSWFTGLRGLIELLPPPLALPQASRAVKSPRLVRVLLLGWNPHPPPSAKLLSLGNSLQPPLLWAPFAFCV